MEQSELALERPIAGTESLMNVSDLITYEQPLNELTRVCLRIEQLFLESDHLMEDSSPLGTRQMVIVILHLLQILERTDLKAKLAKELSLQAQSLARLEQSEEVDPIKLQRLLDQLSSLSQNFIASNCKIAQNLREIELLNSLKLHLATPGGGGSFDTPLFYYWLQEPASKRQATIQSWLAEFDSIRLASHLLLKLLRKEITRGHPKNAIRGFYQELLDAQSSLRLIRVMLPAGTQAFPEISLSRHFMSIRFLLPDIKMRATQLQHDLSFWLAYCNG